jgi:hypothetical protein
MLAATWITAIATAVLGVLAVVTAWYARKAFRKQSEEVRVIEQQVRDGQEVSRQQAELLKVQSDQLELQRHQLEDQREANAAQAEVLKLQADELRESLKQREREAEERRRVMASSVFVAEHVDEADPRISQAQRMVSAIPDPTVTARVRNNSDQPVYEAELRWHRGSASWGEPNPEPLGTIMPGQEVVRLRSFEFDTNMDVSGSVLRFTDAAGVRWLRRPDGYLGEV